MKGLLCTIEGCNQEAAHLREGTAYCRLHITKIRINEGPETYY